ncbi:putative ABC transporter ATP-binding protein YxlF [Novipirellula aureliae]|uniref:Putative ABC transporter ATP-binding protein YxlF n=1 Tax=Novipirellula aureliae TaxID=2527966 RepID=A0A5C6DX44_9BACT|nr:ABC transporter ATP-binding protein [Novipirellula aureliae]TWU41228.1 putative ABC transporter ATP-binding protein YxlF [Novipirellula aureliae]
MNSKLSVQIDAVPVLSCNGLSKRYGDFSALSDCSVRVDRGDVYGLLGPNGAGKTTLIRILLGFLHPTGGDCRVLGIDPVADSVAVRRQVAYLPGDARLPRHMKGEGVLKFFSEMHPFGELDRSRRIAEQLELNTKTRVAFMSTGMRQKLALAVVLGPQTPFLILDEPTANLDPTVRATVLRLVMEARDHGRTVMLSSHVLSEIEDTCNRVAFLRKGRLAHELKMSELFQRHRMTALTSVAVDVPEALNSQVSLQTTRLSETQYRVQIDTSGDLAPILTWVNTLPLSHVRFEPFGLRTIYDSVHTGEISQVTTAASPEPTVVL